jgi:hypothetical protein
MGDKKVPVTRRQLLGTTGSLSLVGLAGCLGQSGDHGKNGHSEPRERPLLAGAENCISENGDERDPESLSAKDSVDYQFHPNYLGGSGFMEMCANCRFFCDGAQFDSDSSLGACSKVEGGIHSQDWCALWQAASNIENRESSGSRWFYGRK